MLFRSVPANHLISVSRPRRRREVRDPYDGLRPWSAITHGVGAVLALAGTVYLAVQSVLMGKWGHLVVFLIYGLSMVCLYTASTLYHCVNTTRSKRIALRKYDHCSIYLLIAGSYTPCLLYTSLEIYTERDGSVIFKKYSLLGGLTEFAGQMCETLNLSLIHI